MWQKARMRNGMHLHSDLAMDSWVTNMRKNMWETIVNFWRGLQLMMGRGNMTWSSVDMVFPMFPSFRFTGKSRFSPSLILSKANKFTARENSTDAYIIWSSSFSIWTLRILCNMPWFPSPHLVHDTTSPQHSMNSELLLTYSSQFIIFAC